MTRRSDLRSPLPVLLAAWSTWLSALALAGVGVGSIVVGHGRFSIGVGAMLIGYALFVALIGRWLVRRASWADGPLVASGILHLVVVVSLVRSGAPAWFLVLAALAGVAVVSALLPVSRRWLAGAPQTR
ncbi:MAG: hypothetical protein SOH99_04220 [Acidipropionibacterium acidipropionici]|uniref:hypothetical protein n=1 Tax=Acidipropionibacterium acidipropionici TaxID=1748 RepID=UPI001E49CC3F|nr:hypothetical protein [Acidipropionibacterium acidipropionici]